MARRKFPDPVFLLAGGPGQSAIAVAASTMALFSRLNNRRDIVFVDQRGTGGSAPLVCPDAEHESLAEQADPDRQYRLAVECKAQLLKLPYIKSESDLGLFTTSIAVQDLDAVRRELGAERIDLVGASYGTRVALEYQRQFPKAVRRSVIDGVAPPDMALPASFSLDNQAALRCARRRLRRRAGVRARPSRPASALRGAAAIAAAHGQGGASAERARRGVRPDARHAARRGAQRALCAGAGRGAARGDRHRVARRVRRPGRLERDLHVAQGDAAGDRHAPVGRLRRGRAAASLQRRQAGRRLRPRVRALLRAAVLGVAARRGAGGVLRRWPRRRRRCWR